MSENLNQWFGLTRGGRLELSVRSKTEGGISFAAFARVVPTRGTVRHWRDSDLNPGPKRLYFATDVSYAIRVAVKFFGTASETAVITARVFDADGELVPDWWGDMQYVYVVKGRAGVEPARVSLFLIAE